MFVLFPMFLNFAHHFFFFFYLGDEQQQLDKRKERNVKRELGSSSSLHEAGCGNQPSSRASVCQFLQCLHDGYTSLGSVLLGNFCFIFRSCLSPVSGKRIIVPRIQPQATAACGYCLDRQFPGSYTTMHLRKN